MIHAVSGRIDLSSKYCSTASAGYLTKAPIFTYGRPLRRCLWLLRVICEIPVKTETSFSVKSLVGFLWFSKWFFILTHSLRFNGCEEVATIANKFRGWISRRDHSVSVFFVNERTCWEVLSSYINVLKTWIGRIIHRVRPLPNCLLRILDNLFSIVL